MHARLQRFPKVYTPLFFLVPTWIFCGQIYYECLQLLSYFERPWKKGESTLLMSLFKLDPSYLQQSLFWLKKTHIKAVHVCSHIHFGISSKWLDFRDLHSFSASFSAGNKVATQLFSASFLSPVSASQIFWKTKTQTVCVCLHFKNKVWTLW